MNATLIDGLQPNQHLAYHLIFRIYPLPIDPGGMGTVVVCVVTVGVSVDVFADSVDVDSLEDVVVDGAVTADVTG